MSESQQVSRTSTKHLDIKHSENSIDPKEFADLEAIDNHEVSLAQLLKAHPVPKWSAPRIRLYLTIMCLYLVATSSGFDGSLMTSINTLQEYKDYFNLGDSATGTGLVFLIYPAGSMASCGLVWLADYIGRVYTICAGLIVLIVGAIISATTTNHDAFIGARFILAFGCTLSITCTPAYLVEVIPSDMKHLVLIYNTFYYIGSLIATWTMYGTEIHYAGTHESFSIALWLQILCPGIVLCCILFAPESPRYLYSKNKIDKCRDFIIKYHAGGDSTHPIVLAEMNQIAESYQESGFLTPKDYLDFRVFFRTVARRKRTALVVVWSWFSQFSGNQVVTYYMTTLFLNLGITNATTRLLLTAINSIICLITSNLGAYVVERLGRRPVLLGATIIFVICFVSLTAATKTFNDDNNNEAAAKAGIFFIYFFQAVFSFGYTALQPILASEYMNNDMRARGLALWHLVGNAASFLNLYTAPIAMENIKHFYYLFFALWDLFELFVIYFFFVETSRLTLEEIEYVFSKPHSVKESIKMSTAARKGDVETIKAALGEMEVSRSVSI